MIAIVAQSIAAVIVPFQIVEVTEMAPPADLDRPRQFRTFLVVRVGGLDDEQGRIL